MKAIFLTLLSDIDPDVYKAITLIIIIVIVMRFIISILGKMLNHKLKNKIIDKEIPIELATSILQSETKNEQHSNIKWIAILLSTGIGLFITEHYSPLGIHSFGIMVTSIALGLISYSIYLKYSSK